MRDIVCVGGWATGPTIWEPLLAALGWRDRAVCVPWWEGVAQGSAALGNVLRRERPCLLVGWSLGSLRVLEAALEEPASVRGMILLSATARHTADADYPGVPRPVIRAMRRRLASDREAVLEAFFGECLKPEVEPALVAALCGEARPIPTDWLAAGLDYLVQTDLRPALSRLAVPALLLHGEADAVVPPACGRVVAASLPQATWLTLPEGGHLLPWRPLETVAEKIHDWTEQNDPR